MDGKISGFWAECHWKVSSRKQNRLIDTFLVTYLLLMIFISFLLSLNCTLIFIFFKLIYLLFIFGCVGSLLLRVSSCGERGLLFVAVRELLIKELLLLRSTGSRHEGFSSCGARAQ